MAEDASSGPRAGSSAGLSAWLFPGQGAQRVGMGRDLYDAYPEAAAIFDEADAAIGRSLSRIIFEGPDDELRQTVNTQPAIWSRASPRGPPRGRWGTRRWPSRRSVSQGTAWASTARWSPRAR